MMKPKAVFCWSGGKDSALALYKILQEQRLDVVALLTTVNSEHGRISMHGVREELLEQQAGSIGIPLFKAYVAGSSNGEYENVMLAALDNLKSRGVQVVVFGDIFLEDLRAYRESMLRKLNLDPEFPLWKIPTDQLAGEFLSAGFKTITCCVSSESLDSSFVGEIYDEGFINSLPKAVDPCGENGEFHTFCYDGPVFNSPIGFKTGEKVFRPLALLREAGEKQEIGFWYCDLIPVQIKSP
jgi:uncharacterized protein (TIGR00290 family)